MFLSSVSGAAEAGARKTKTQMPPCQTDLNAQPVYDESAVYGEESHGYSNSFEEDRRRLEPGPDEVEDRSPERTAIDPGGF